MQLAAWRLRGLRFTGPTECVYSGGSCCRAGPDPIPIYRTAARRSRSAADCSNRLDQVNVPLPLSLRGAGLVNASVTAAGVTSNIGQIYIN